MIKKPVYRRNLDDSPRKVAALATSQAAGHVIPLHMHRRGQLLYAVAGVMRLLDATPAAASPPVDDARVAPRLAASPPATDIDAMYAHEVARYAHAR